MNEYANLFYDNLPEDTAGIIEMGAGQLAAFVKLVAKFKVPVIFYTGDECPLIASEPEPYVRLEVKPGDFTHMALAFGYGDEMVRLGLLQGLRLMRETKNPNHGVSEFAF